MAAMEPLNDWRHLFLRITRPGILVRLDRLRPTGRKLDCRTRSRDISTFRRMPQRHHPAHVCHDVARRSFRWQHPDPAVGENFYLTQRSGSLVRKGTEAIMAVVAWRISIIPRKKFSRPLPERSVSWPGTAAVR